MATTMPNENNNMNISLGVCSAVCPIYINNGATSNR